MKSLQQAHCERIVDHALRIRRIANFDNEFKSYAIGFLKSHGLRALLSMLQEHADGSELKSKPKHLTSEAEGRKIKNNGSINGTQSITDCVIDISDIVNFFLAGHKTVSGIQRLVIATLACIPKNARDSNILISLHDYEKYGCRVVPWELIDSLVKYISSGDDKVDFVYHVRTTISNASLIDALSLDIESHTLLIMGAAWIVPSFPIAHRIIARRHKLHVVSILYDLIPYTYPDFVSPDASREFLFYISSLLSISDALISISKYVSDDLANHIDSLGQNLISYPLNYHAELAREIPFKVQKASHKLLKKTMREKLIELGVEADNFILNVGSVEIRKNHIGLFVAWRHLLAQMEANCPQLVVVGRPGWKAESFLEALKSTNNLDGKLIVLHGIDDSVLSYLYETCKLTVYPSLEEGWGLPIGESLDAGKLCVTSNRASMPEVGRELCRYVNPFDPLAIAREVIQLLENPRIISLTEQKIAAEKPLKSWAEYQIDIANLVNAVRQERPEPVSAMAATNWFLQSGQTVSFYWHLGSETYDLPEALSGKKRSLHGSFPSRLIPYTQLDRFESDGAWCREPKLGLEFHINIRDIKSNSFSVYLHYHFHETKTPIRHFGLNAKLTIFNNSTPSNYNNTAVNANSNIATTYSSPEAQFIANDLVVFNFGKIDFAHHKQSNNQGCKPTETDYVPVKVEIEWIPGFHFVCSNGRTLECIKVKEIRLDY